MRTGPVLAAALFVLAAGCGRTTLDTPGLEGQIRSLLERRGVTTISRIDCPDDVAVKEGSTFECTASGEGVAWVISITQRDDRGSVDMQIHQASEGV